MQISDKKERTLTFGKYKGQEIKYIILTDIGYIGENGAYPPTQNGIIHPQLLLKWA